MQVREYNLIGDKIEIIQNSGLKSVSSLILIDNTALEKEIYYYYLRLWNRFIKKINYGEFKFEPFSISITFSLRLNSLNCKK